jgi:hypothetical protein
MAGQRGKLTKPTTKVTKKSFCVTAYVATAETPDLRAMRIESVW